MAMKNVIFNRPVRIGKVIFPKSKRSVEVEEKELESPFMQELIKLGDITVPAAPKAEKAPAAPAPAAKAKA